MRKDWVVKKLGDVCKFSQGIQVDLSLQSTEQKENRNRFLRITDYTIGDIDKRFVDKQDLKYYVYPDDIVIVRYGASAGFVGINKEGILANNLFKLNHDKTILNYKFLYYCLSTDYYKKFIQKLAFGAAMPALSFSTFKDFNIPVPPLQTQQQIVEELDCLNSIIEKQKKQLEELDNLAQSIFYDMFGDPIENEKGWEFKKIEDLCSVVGGSTPKTNIPEYWDGDNYWVTPAELNEKYISSTIRSITDKGVKSANLKMLPKGTVLFTSRAPIGKVSITRAPMYCNQGFKNFICSDIIINEYLYHVLLYNTEYLNSLGVGATFKEVSKSKISSVRISLPPLSLQQQFASKIEAIEKQKELIKKSIKETEDLFNSRMDYYFN